MRLSSVSATFTFMSCKNALNLTLAPASRHTRANMRSVGEARFRNLPVWGQAALWRPDGSRRALQPEHTASSMGRGSWSLSRSNTRNKCGAMTYSGEVGARAKAAPALWPECDRRWARDAAERASSMVVFLKCESETEDAQYCQPCFHSPGSSVVLSGGLFPWRSSGHPGLHQKPTRSN